jgi:general secretion pathway protein I
MSRSGRWRQRGLSLLELLVAFAIMAIALGMLYKASGSSARSVSEAASYQRAMSLAESLLSMRDAVPAQGWNEAGQSAQFSWKIHSQPYATLASQGNLAAPVLHAVEVGVEWSEGTRLRRIDLHTLRPQRNVPAGTGLQR